MLYNVSIHWKHTLIRKKQKMLLISDDFFLNDRMIKMALTGSRTETPDQSNRIFCPALHGLTPPQTDLAFVMPRMDHNRQVRENHRQGDWAALLASDPFGSEATMFGRLHEIGYLGVTNWPSSILLDGTLRQSMSTIPASPEFEYDFLARAQEAGFQAMAFFLSLDQARAALRAGLTRLVLHPGILDVRSEESGAMVLGSLQRLIDAIRAEAKDVSILAYTSAWHEDSVPLGTLAVDGLVWLETGTS